MSRMNRAKQFMPFDALKGFQEALREKEEVFAPPEERKKKEEERGGEGIDSETFGNDRDWREL